MKIKFDFIPQGAVVKTEGDKFVFKSFFQGKETITEWDSRSTVIFDTGNQLGDGIIDHHLPGTEDSSVAQLVALKFESFITNLDRTVDEITLVTHFFPDFDAIGGVYFAKKYLENGSVPNGSLILSEYINEVDSGKLTLDPKSPINPASMILAISDHVSKNNDIPFPQKHLAILEKSFELLDKIIDIFSKKDNPWMPNFLDELFGFDDLKRSIIDDALIYRSDLEKSTTQTLKLINNQTGIVEDVDFIATDNPKSFLWKYWVRGDRENSTLGQGFIINCAFFDTFKAQGRNRAIIATDPNTPYSLKGLGILIEKYEIASLIQNHNETKESLCENSRPGFHRADPWYDGRAPIHNYTIIDAPRAGSVLTNDELLDCIRMYELWQSFGKNIALFSEFDQIVNYYIDNSSLANDDIIAEHFNSFKQLKYDAIDGDFLKIETISKQLMHFPVKNDFVCVKKDQLREHIFKQIIEFVKILPISETKKWSLKFAHLIVNYYPSKYSKELVEQSESLSFDALVLLINRTINELSKDKILPFLFTIMNNHSESYKEIRNELSIGKEIISINNSNYNEFIHKMIKFSNIYDIPIDTMEASPIYAVSSFKNMIDDMLVSTSLNENQILVSEVKDFIQNDYAELLDIYKNKSFFDGANSEYTKKFNSFIMKFLIEKHLGKNLSLFRQIRAELLASPIGKKFEKFKKLNPEDYLKLGIEEFNEVLEHFSNILDLNNIKEKQFFVALKLLHNIAILKNLLFRVSKGINLDSINNDTVISEFLKSNHLDLYYVNNFTFKLFDANIIQYTNLSNEEYYETINELIEIINKLKTAPQTTQVNYIEYFNKLFVFLSNILLENELPLKDLDKVLEVSFEQYSLLTDEDDNLIELTNSLPIFYSSILLEILVSYKVHYLQKIHFLQSELKSLSEAKSDFNYRLVSTKIASKSIEYECLSIKKLIDLKSEDKLMSLFYNKYFDWKQSTSELSADNIENIKKVAKQNSIIRKTLGTKNVTLESKVTKLPNVVNQNSTSNHFEYLCELENSHSIISHFQYQFYVDSYEYISDYFIERYDIDTVSDAIENYSSDYPWYMKFLTNTRMIQVITLLFIGLIFSASIFNSSSYPILDEDNIDEGVEQLQAPLSEFIRNTIGNIPFTIISESISYFWLFFIGIIFIGPLFYGISKLINVLLKKKKENKLPFLKYLEKIESKRSSLLYLQFITPLLIVLLNIASGDTIDLIDNYTGLRFFSLLIIIIAMIYFSVLKDVASRNPDKTKNWLAKRTTHLIWLYYFQSLIVTIFLIDLMLRYQIELSELYEGASDYFFLGISKYVYYQINIPIINIDFDIVLMPVATILISLLSLFFSFFVDRVFGGND